MRTSIYHLLAGFLYLVKNIENDISSKLDYQEEKVIKQLSIWYKLYKTSYEKYFFQKYLKSDWWFQNKYKLK